MTFYIRNNLLHYYVQLQCNEHSDHSIIALKNIINSMSLSRNGTICGETFSGLDFGNIPFNDIHFSLKGKYPSSFENCTINEWNFISGHSDSITSVAYSHDGSQVLTGSEDTTAILWDANAGLMKYKFEGHLLPIEHVIFLPDESNCLTWSYDYTTILWNTKSGELVQKINPMYMFSITTSNDKKCLVGGWKEVIVCTSNMKDVIYRLQAIYQDNITSVAISNDNKRCLTCSDDRTAAILWDMDKSNDTPIGVFDENIPIKIFDEDINVVSSKFLSDNRVCLIGYHDSLLTLIIHDLKFGRKEYKLEKITEGLIPFAACSPDGKFCLTGIPDDSNIKIWEIESGKLYQNLKGHRSGVRSAAFSPDSKTCITGSDDKSAIMWDVSSGNLICRFNGYQDRIITLSYTLDNKLLTISRDGVLTIWDINTATIVSKILTKFTTIVKAAFSADGKMCAVSSGYKVEIFDTQSGRQIETFEMKDVVHSLNFIPKCKLLLIGMWRKRSILYAINKEIDTTIPNIHIGLYSKIIFPSDTTDVYAGIKLKTLFLVDSKTGTVLKTFNGHISNVKTAIFSPDGLRLLSISDDKTAIIWDVNNGNIRIKLEGYSDSIIAADFTSDGKSVITASKDKKVIIWDISTGQKIRQFEIMHFKSKIVKEIVISADLNLIASYDGCLTTLTTMEGIHISTLYNINNISIKNCTFSNITSNDTTKSIIKQQGGILI